MELSALNPLPQTRSEGSNFGREPFIGKELSALTPMTSKSPDCDT